MVINLAPAVFYDARSFDRADPTFRDRTKIGIRVNYNSS